MYRRKAEPVLYRHIHLTSSQDVSMRWLVVTVLYRPELAAHIRTVRFSEDHRTSEDIVVKVQQKSQPSELLERAVGKLHRMTKDMLGSDTTKADIRVSWMAPFGGLPCTDHDEKHENPLTGFVGLTGLNTLRVDLDTLVDSKDRSALLKLNKLLPSNVGALHVTGVGQFEFWSLVNTVSPPDQRNLYLLADSCSFKAISITIDVEQGSGAEHEWRFIKSTLVHIARGLWAQKEITLQIYSLTENHESAPRLRVDRKGFYGDKPSAEEPEVD
ncbi:hypothetical protein SVAN01_04107 [Stagonosporopsis vannaccii]|nr:hypothetical protein SVAN01_04107 [Stagonosporopsis vannaccii]